MLGLKFFPYILSAALVEIFLTWPISVFFFYASSFLYMLYVITYNYRKSKRIPREKKKKTTKKKTQTDRFIALETGVQKIRLRNIFIRLDTS